MKMAESAFGKLRSVLQLIVDALPTIFELPCLVFILVLCFPTLHRYGSLLSGLSSVQQQSPASLQHVVRVLPCVIITLYPSSSRKSFSFTM